MSEETTEYFNDLKGAQALERKQRLAIRQLEISNIQKLGYYVGVLNNGYHIRLRWLDYWPSTGKWRNEKRKRYGWLKDGESLLELVEREVGKAGPELAKKAVEKAVNA